MVLCLKARESRSLPNLPNSFANAVLMNKAGNFENPDGWKSVGVFVSFVLFFYYNLSMKRIILAILVAASMPAIFFGALEFFDQLQYFSGQNIHFTFQAVSTIWLFAFVVALAHALLLGLPLYLVLKRFNLTQWWMSLQHHHKPAADWEEEE